MLIILSILGLRHDDTTHPVVLERFTDTHFALVLLAALSHHHRIAPHIGLFLDAGKNAGKVEMIDLGDDDPDKRAGTSLATAQRFGNGIRIKIMFARESLDTLTLLLRDTRRILQRPRYRCHAHAQFAGNILHCVSSFLCHDKEVSNLSAKLYKTFIHCIAYKFNNKVLDAQTFAHLNHLILVNI